MIDVRLQPVRVFVIAPPMVGWGLERLVQTAHPQLEFCGRAAGLLQSERHLESCVVDVVVVDLDGSEDLGQLAVLQEKSKSRFVLLTSSNDMAMLDRAVVAGLRGVVRKSDPTEVLLKAIDKVHDGELWIDRSATSRIFMEMARQHAAQNNDPVRSKIATLTSRERQTIIAVASDAAAPGKVIAGRLCISEHTLRNHLTSIYSKLGLSNRLDLYAFATKHRLNSPL